MELEDYISKNFDKFTYGEKNILNNVNGNFIRKNINTIEDGIPLLSKLSQNINKDNMKDTTNVHEKLKKNIIESLLVEQPLYNDVKNISGPLRICYYFNKELNKKIILMGDNHIGINFSCPKDSITIENYLHELFKLDFDIDLFIEFDLPQKEYLEKNILVGPMPKGYKPEDSHSYHWEPGYLDEIRSFGYRNYKKKEGKRIHLTDLRAEESIGFFKLSTISNSYIKTIAAYKTHTDVNHKFIMSIKKYFESNGTQIDTNIPDYLKKELDRLQKSENKDVISKIKNHILKNIKLYESLYDPEQINIAMTDKIPELTIIHNVFERQYILNAILSDIYTIARIMKSNEFNNNILYYGDDHISNIIIMLELLNFKVRDIKKSEDYDYCKLNSKINCDGFRCVRNVLQFDKFFKED